MKLIIAIVTLSFACYAAAVAGTFGTGVDVKANTATTIDFGLTQLVITTTADATITFNILVETAFSLDASLNQYTIGSLASAAINIGYSLDVSTGSITSATVTSDALAASFLAALVGNVFGVLYYDVSTQGYLELPATLTLTKATFNLPFKGKYAFVFRVSTAAAAKLFDNAIAVAANVANKVQFHSESTANLVITQTTNAASTLTVTESSSAPSNVGSKINGRTRISSYFNLESSVASGITNLMQYTISAENAAKADVSTFAWYFYDTATKKWELDASSSVDVNAKVVTRSSSSPSSLATNWVVTAESSLSLAVLPTALLVTLALFASMMM